MLKPSSQITPHTLAHLVKTIFLEFKLNFLSLNYHCHYHLHSLIFRFSFTGLYIKVAEWRRNCVCPCGLSKKQQQQQILALNPSTDPLVTHTQYAPVSEIPRVEDEERRNLMPDNKDG